MINDMQGDAKHAMSALAIPTNVFRSNERINDNEWKKTELKGIFAGKVYSKLAA